jgi:hypothetical protein
MFGAIRRFLFGQRSKDPPESKSKLRLAVDLLEDDDTINNRIPEEQEEDDLENLADRVKDIMQEVRIGGDNMPVYLATLDTTNRPEVKDRGLQGGLKNFYFVRAASAEKAREMVLGTFAHRPQILGQIQYSVTITELKKIVDVVTNQYPMWSYVPIRKGVRAPGQKATPPTQQVNPNDRDEVIPMREPPQVITPPSQDDTPKQVAPEAQAPQMPNMNGMDPQQMMAAMMGMFGAMMNGQQPQMPTATPPAQKPGFDGVPGVSVTRADPNQDPELQQRLHSVQETAQARHASHTGIGDAIVGVQHDEMDELQKAESEARAEVEAFKRLPKSKQTSGLDRIDMNDNKDIDMDTFRQIHGRIGEGRGNGEMDL